jgi:hypothetical protein
MFEVVGSQPPFDLPERCGLADHAEDMLDPAAFTAGVETGFALSYATELVALVCEDLLGLRVFVDGVVEEPDHVLRGAFLEDVGCSYESEVVV